MSLKIEMCEQEVRSKKVIAEIDKWERAYLSRIDWESRENANTNISFGAFVGYIVSKVLKEPEVLSRYFSRDVVEFYSNCDIHIHKLPLSLFIPYCSGWSLQKLFIEGLKTPTVISRPAKHFDTAISHTINFFFLIANEWSGAQATSGFDLLVAPFVREDDLSRKEIRQSLQKMVFELNYPSRIGFQSPFTNITIVIDLIKEYLESDAIVGGKKVGKAGEFLDEAIMVDEELLRLYLEGDSKGRPFTFPIITLMLTPSFDWNGTRWDDLTDLIFEVLAKRGSLYVLNGYATDIGGLFAMCCRLTIQADKVKKMNFFKFMRDVEEEQFEEMKKSKGPRGVWATPDATGSVGVVTINLPRLAILSNGDESVFFDLLQERLQSARKVILWWRERYVKSLINGLMPLTKIYLSSFAGHFGTFGLIGLPEAAVNLIGDLQIWQSSRVMDAVQIMRKIVAFVRKYSEECEEIDGFLYNVEEVPGESAAYRLAMADFVRFKNKIDRGEAFIPILDGEPMYSNSIIPYYASIPLYRRVKLEGIVQQEFTGGVMAHLFFGEAMDPKALKELIYRFAMNTKIVYFSITPAISTCTSCNWKGIGVYWKCPKCGSQTEVWSRIVGYYRPVQTWHHGRKAEFKSRIHYKIRG